MWMTGSRAHSLYSNHAGRCLDGTWKLGEGAERWKGESQKAPTVPCERGGTRGGEVGPWTTHIQSRETLCKQWITRMKGQRFSEVIWWSLMAN